MAGATERTCDFAAHHRHHCGQLFEQKIEQCARPGSAVCESRTQHFSDETPLPHDFLGRPRDQAEPLPASLLRTGDRCINFHANSVAS
jgi:hypothetical protein